MTLKMRYSMAMGENKWQKTFMQRDNVAIK